MSAPLFDKRGAREQLLYHRDHTIDQRTKDCFNNDCREARQFLTGRESMRAVTIELLDKLEELQFHLKDERKDFVDDLGEIITRARAEVYL